MYFIILLIITLLLLFHKIKWWRHMKYLSKIPGPPTHFIPIFGNVHQFYGPLDYLWRKLRQLGEEYPICRLWGFEEAMVMIRQPDDAEMEGSLEIRSESPVKLRIEQLQLSFRFAMYLIILLIIILSLLFYKIKWYRHVKYLNKIPGPPTHFIPIFGNLHQIYGPLDYMWRKLRQLGEEYPIYRFWAFEEAMVMIRHPDDAEVLLTNKISISKAPMYDFGHPWIGSGLLTSTGTKWRNRRKILIPALNFNTLKQYIKVFDIQDKRLVDSIKNSEERTIDTIPLFTRFTLNTICGTMMGISLEEVGVGQEEYRKAMYEIGQMTFHQVQNPLSQVGWLFKLLPSGRRQAASLKILHNFSGNVIEKRKKYHVSSKQDIDEDDGRKKGTAFMDLLLELWRDGGIDDSGIQEEVDTFIFAGHDTTTSALAFTTLLLAENKEIQERARREVNEVFQVYGETLGMTELNNLVYLERCIKEALRLFPSTPAIARKLSEDVRLSGYLVPKDTTVNLSIYDLHRDPNFWPNPLAYDPDRFLPEASRNRHPYSYIPFSAGPRNCIGQKFSMLELKSALAHLLRNFYLEAVDKTKDICIVMDIIMHSAHPLRVKFIPTSNVE